MVIGDMPLPASWFPYQTEETEGYLIKGAYDDETVIRDSILPRLSTLPFEPDSKEFVFDAGPLYLFDATLSGKDADFAEDEKPIVIPCTEAGISPEPAT